MTYLYLELLKSHTTLLYTQRTQEHYSERHGPSWASHTVYVRERSERDPG